MPVQSTCSHCGAACRVPSTRWRPSGNYCQIACYYAAQRIRFEATLLSRLWAKVNYDGPIPAHRPDLGPCWIWTGRPGNHGYGCIGVNGKVLLVHRVTWANVNGPIPEGLHIDHLCRVLLCVRPTHLEAVTPGVNFRRSEHPSMIAFRNNTCTRGHPRIPENVYRKMRAGKPIRDCRACILESRRKRYVPKPELRARGERCKSARLTESAVRAIRRLHIEGVTVAALACTYGVTKEAIYAVLNRRTWAHVN